MAKKKTPLKVNESLVKRTRLTNYYSGGAGSTTGGEWNTDNLFTPEKQIMSERMADNEKLSKNKKQDNKNKKKPHSHVENLKKQSKLHKKQSKLDQVLEKRIGKHGEDSDKIENWRTKRLRKKIDNLQDNYNPQNLNPEVYVSEFNEGVELPVFRGGNIVANNDNEAYITFKNTGEVHNDGSPIVEILNSRGDIIDKLSKTQIVEKYPNLEKRKGRKYFVKGWETQDQRTRKKRKKKSWKNSPMKHPIEEPKNFRHIHNDKGMHWVPKNFPTISDANVSKSHKGAPRTGSNIQWGDNDVFFDPNYKGPTRKNYLPKKDITSPLRQNDEMAEEMSGVISGKDIYDTWKEISEEQLEQQKENYIENFNFGITSPARIDILGNPKWKELSRNYLNKVKNNISNAINDGQTDYAAKWMDNARNFINNIKIFENKKVEDWARQYTDESQSNAGGSIISKGSHKGDMRKYDMTYMGANNINMEIAEEGDIYWKMEDIDDIWTVKDLGRNIHYKNFKGIQLWNDFKKQLGRAAKEDVPVTDSSIKGTIDSMLRNEAAILSFAHDNLAGNQSMYEMYEEEGLRRGVVVDPDPFMPESTEYNLDMVKNMVKKGLIDMAKQIYSSNMPKQVNDIIQDIDGKNLSAKELIKKYSK